MKTKKITQVFTNANILEASIEHNGLKGGDAGHGGFVELTFRDVASTSMEVNGQESELVSLTFRGDTERETLLEALKFFVKELEDHKKI
jgi:hypothetical protein